MEWMTNTFYLHPIPVLYLTAAVYLSAIIWYFGRDSVRAKKTAYPTGLRPLSLNQFMQYINDTETSYIGCGYDGSRLGMPIIEGILTGTYNEYTISLFQLVLPTGRSGISQTVLHIRSATGTLPCISRKDPVLYPEVI